MKIQIGNIKHPQVLNPNQSSPEGIEERIINQGENIYSHAGHLLYQHESLIQSQMPPSR